MTGTVADGGTVRYNGNYVYLLRFPYMIGYRGGGYGGGGGGGGMSAGEGMMLGAVGGKLVYRYRFW